MLSPILEQKLQQAIDAQGSLSEAARSLGFSKQYLSRVLQEKCPPSDKLLFALGLERKIVKVRQ